VIAVAAAEEEGEEEEEKRRLIVPNEDYVPSAVARHCLGLAPGHPATSGHQSEFHEHGLLHVLMQNAMCGVQQEQT
jgi:hypothetical protein